MKAFIENQLRELVLHVFENISRDYVKGLV